MTGSVHQITLETLDPDRHTGEETRAELAKRLGAEVGAPDEGLFDLRVVAESREEALQRVADALAELGVEQHFTFPSTTGTGYHPPGRRGVRRAASGRALGAFSRRDHRFRPFRVVRRLGALRVRLRSGGRLRRGLLGGAGGWHFGELEGHFRLRRLGYEAPVPESRRVLTFRLLT